MPSLELSTPNAPQTLLPDLLSAMQVRAPSQMHHRQAPKPDATSAPFFKPPPIYAPSQAVTIPQHAPMPEAT